MKYFFLTLLVVSTLGVWHAPAQAVEVEVQTGNAANSACAPVNPPTPDQYCRFDEVRDENNCVTGYVQVCEQPGIFTRIWNWFMLLFKRS